MKLQSIANIPFSESNAWNSQLSLPVNQPNGKSLGSSTLLQGHRWLLVSSYSSNSQQQPTADYTQTSKRKSTNKSENHHKHDNSSMLRQYLATYAWVANVLISCCIAGILLPVLSAHMEIFRL